MILGNDPSKACDGYLIVRDLIGHTNPAMEGNLTMQDFVTIAIFNSAFDIKLAMAKGLLEESGIEFYTTNENFRSVEPPIGLLPQNMCIELRVSTEKSEDALQVLKTILDEN